MMKIIAAINNKNRKTFVELPTHAIELRNALKEVGITADPGEVKITDDENADYQVRMFADDEIGQEVLRLVRKTDNLALLDDTLWSLAAHDWSTVRDALEDGCARTLRQLHDQFEPDSEKMVLSAIMDPNSNPLQIHDCVVEKQIPMPSDQFQQMLRHPTSFEGFFRKYDELMFRDWKGQYHCILPYNEQTGDGILIDTEGCSYPKYYQLVPNAKLLIEHYETQHEQTADQTEDESPEISGISM